LAIQQLVDGMLNPPFPFPAFLNCCTQINNATPPEVSPDICDAVIDLSESGFFDSGSDLQTLKDVLRIFNAFGNDSLSVSTFITTAEGVNAESGGLSAICASSALPLGYCVNPTDSLAFVITAIVAIESIFH
jgi:hypothetical protein